jgi:glycosyltransferase involved in cell wall biosynthesis
LKSVIQANEDKNSPPLFSIITPTYNYGHFIEDALLSVKNQDYPRVEHIVVDGGSTDCTVEILKKYQAFYNLRWVSEKDRGQSDAINKGFRMARGEIIGWLNSDDVYFSSGALSFVAKQFETYPSVDVIYGDNACINEKNLLLKVRRIPNFSPERLLRVDYICQPSVFFRKSITDRYTLDIDIDLPMDYELWLRLVKNGVTFKHVKKFLSAERIQPEMKTRSRWEEMKVETKRIQKNYGQQHGKKFKVLNSCDNLLIMSLKLYSILSIVKLYSRGLNDIPFETSVDSLPELLRRQLLFV